MPLFIRIGLSLLLGGICYALPAQEISSFKGKRAFDLSGGISLNTATFNSSLPGANNRPFTWTISGSPTVSLWGISIPFSFVYSEQDRSFRQPFNRFGASPRWKWLTLHGGHRNVSFSKYTLGGWQFLGGGVETTGKLRLGAIYGQFMRPVDVGILDTLNRDLAIPSFDRRGYAFKLGVGTPRNYWDFVFFRASDDTLSVASAAGRKAGTPQDNVALGAKANFTFFRIVTLDLDAGASALTRNRFAEEIEIGTDYPKNLVRYFRPNVTTQVRFAGDAGIALRLRHFNLRLSYTQIQQDYATLGVYNFNADVERILLSPGATLWKGKVQVQTSVGVQRNNTLGNLQRQSVNRNIGFNITLRPKQHWNANINYYNFQNNLQRNPGYPVDQLDSLLNFRQAMQTAATTLSYRMGSKDRAHLFGFNISGNRYGENNTETGNDNANLSVAPSFSWRMDNRPAGWQVGSTASAGLVETSLGNIIRWTAALNGTKKWLKDRYSATLNTGLTQTRLSGATSNGLGWFVRARGSLRIQKTHTLALSLNLTDAPRLQGGRIQTFNGNLTYNYSLASIFSTKNTPTNGLDHSNTLPTRKN